MAPGLRRAVPETHMVDMARQGVDINSSISTAEPGRTTGKQLSPEAPGSKEFKTMGEEGAELVRMAASEVA